MIDQVKCMICGKKTEQITPAHLKKHDITYREYRDMFPNSSYITDRIRNKHIKRRIGITLPVSKEKKLKSRHKSFVSFMERVDLIHGNRFKYDEESYTNIKSKVKILCDTHGWFEQVAFDHLKLNGCKLCHQDKKRKPKKERKWTTEKFIKEATIIHNGKYDYSKSIYNKALEDIIITCRTHGDFICQPSRHILKKNGCMKCHRSYYDRDTFIERSIEKFGHVYDYSKVEFKKCGIPVSIICKKHGVFNQKPTEHIQASIGCPSCSYNVSSKETAWLDSLKLPQTVVRNTKIKINGRIRSVDAYDESTNTIYEFWGDWWHGNPLFFDSHAIHPKAKKTFGQLYQDTISKISDIENDGFNLIDIWEHEWDTKV